MGLKRGRPRKEGNNIPHDEGETRSVRRRRMQRSYNKTYRQKKREETLKYLGEIREHQDNIFRLIQPQLSDLSPSGPDPAVGSTAEHVAHLVDEDVKTVLDSLSMGNITNSSDNTDSSSMSDVNDNLVEIDSALDANEDRDDYQAYIFDESRLEYINNCANLDSKSDISGAYREDSSIRIRADSSSSFKPRKSQVFATPWRPQSCAQLSYQDITPQEAKHRSASLQIEADNSRTMQWVKRAQVETQSKNVESSTPVRGSKSALEQQGIYEVDNSTPARGLKSQATTQNNDYLSDPHDSTSKVARTLLRHLLNPQPCQSCISQEVPRNHENNRDQICGLRRTYTIPNAPEFIPKVLQSQELLSSFEHGNKSSSDSRFREIYCGLQLAGLDTKPPRLDLSTERPSRCAKPFQSFDIDSILGFIPSLDSLLDGLFLFHCPDSTLNIKKDIHFKIPVECEDEMGQARHVTTQFRDIPHFPLGSVNNRREVLVYLVFPHLVRPGHKFESLSHEQNTFIQDELIRPAMLDLPTHVRQHLCASYAVADLNSKARQTEARVAYTASYQARQNIGHPVSREYMEDMWRRIRDLSAQCGRQEFNRPLLFINAKDLKLSIRSSSEDTSLAGLFRKFDSWLGDIFDLEMIDKDNFYADVAREITPPYGADSEKAATRPLDQYQTYFFKKCCLQSWQQGLHGENSKSQKQFFTNYFLAQAANMTCTPSPREALGQEKVLYTQYYSCHKESMSAASLMPFQGQMDDMGIDPNVRESVASAAGVAVTQLPIIQNAYAASKRRVYQSMRDTRTKAYGVRIELRCRLSLIGKMQQILETEPQESSLLKFEPRIQVPDFIWIIPTFEVNDYISGNANKFCAGIEMSLARTTPLGRPNWGQTQMIIALLRLLRFFVHASDIRRDLALSANILKCPERTIRGLGLKKALERYNFAWLPPKLFRWKDVSVHSKYRSQMLFASRHLIARYKRRYGRAKTTTDDFSTLLDCEDWLREFKSLQSRIEIIRLIVHIILREFRRDVRQNIERDAKSFGCTNLQPGGDIKLSFDEIRKFTSEEPRLVEGNKQKTKSVLDMLDWLYGLEPDYKRGRWDRFAYRGLIRKAYQVLEATGDWYNEAARQFSLILRVETIKYHWILPMVNQREFHQKDHGTRPWFSIVRPLKDKIIDRSRLELERLPNSQVFAFGRGQYNRGSPPELPSFVSWTATEWRAVLAQREQRALTASSIPDSPGFLE